MRENPYLNCPTYKTSSFTLRLVETGDAENLLKCYSNKNAVNFMNADNCTNNFYYQSLAEMKSAIQFWLDSYKKHYFVRLSIISESEKIAVGTVEIFGGEQGVLRIDIMPSYEETEYLSEIINLAVSEFYKDFEIGEILVKAIPKATERRKALEQNGFIEKKDLFRGKYPDYYERKA